MNCSVFQPSPPQTNPSSTSRDVSSRQGPGTSRVPMLCPPSKSGQWNPHPSSLTQTDLLLAKLLQFSLSSQLQGGQEEPSPSQRQPPAQSPGYLTYRRRSSAAAAGSTQAGARRGLLEPCSSCHRQGGGTGGRREWRAQPRARRQAPGIEGCHLQVWGGAWLEEFPWICSTAEPPRSAAFEASLRLGKLIARVRDSQLSTPDTSPSIIAQIPPGALSAPSTAASSGLCSYLLGSSIQIQALQRFQLLHQQLGGKTVCVAQVKPGGLW